jgi:type VI secretion system VasD/TssJ family lipoprotein
MGVGTVVKIASIISLVVLTLSLGGCIEKTGNVTVENKGPVNSLWQWDDQQKNWLYNGGLFAPKAVDNDTVAWKAKEKAIFVNIESPKVLNAFDNAPKALSMKIFQLSDAKAFLHAAKSSSGLKHLLITEQIDPAILSMERLIILPGTSQVVSLDRQENTRYIGIILGYSSLKQDKIFRLIPIVAIDDNAQTLDVSSLLTASLASVEGKAATKVIKTSARPAVLKMNLSLGATGINKLDVEAK